MNFKRFSAAALAAVMTASTLPGALAIYPLDGQIPADGARVAVPTLISANPTADRFNKTLSVNGEVLESYDYDREIPGWGSESVTVSLSEIPTVPTGYIPLRAVVQADEGSAYWDETAYCSTFYYGKDQILADFNDMSVSVNDEKVEGVEALLLEGVTYVPFTVLERLEGVTVTDNSADGVESYDIVTPNGTPLMKLAKAIRETAGMGMGMKIGPTEMEEFYGESLGLKAEYMSEGIGFFPMMISADTLVLGKMTPDSEDALRACFEKYQEQQKETFTNYLPQNLPAIENAKFVTDGDWFMFLIAENADDALILFETGAMDLG